MTRREVASLSRKELAREIAYCTIDPPDDEKIIVMLAQICSIIHNAHSKKEKSRKPQSFIPDWDQGKGEIEPERDEKYWERHFQAFASRLGADPEEVE